MWRPVSKTGNLMDTHEHVTEFAGLPVVDWEAGDSVQNPSRTAFRLRLSWEEAFEEIRRPATGGLLQKLTSLFGRQPPQAPPAPPRPGWTDKLAAFLEDPAADQVAGLVVGLWDEVADGSGPVVEALVAARDRLTGLKALFLGDIIQEESEISWISQSDVSPLLAAYPQLEQFCVRGGSDLSFGALRHPHLKSLIVQSGGLPASVVREVAAADLPELEHLELWLGEENYGGDSTPADLAPLLTGDRFPKLRYLGLRDSEKADEVAAAVATAPLLERVQVLDMSLGTLGDEGAAALLASPAVARLEKLDIRHHFCSDEMLRKLQALGIPVDVAEQHKPEGRRDDTWRYVAVGE
jgi:hypothetical protein